MKKAITFALLSSTLLSMPPALAQEALQASSEICDQNLGEKAINQLLAWDLAKFKFDLFKGVEISGRYKNDVDPSYNEGLFTRVDRYLLKVHVGTARPELREGQDADFVLSARHEDDTEVVFNRQFTNKKEARCAAPYGTKNMPLNAQKTLANLQPGEYFSLKSRMAIVVSGTFLNNLGVNSMGISAAGKYAVNGMFQTHILRMADGKIKMKLVGLKRNEAGLEVAAGFLGDLNIVGISLADKAIESYLDLNPINYTLTTGRNNALIVEYVVDLNDPAAAQAYDQVINKVTDLEDIKENSKALGKQSSRKKRMILDVEALDAIARADQTQSHKRVARGFSASIDSKYVMSNLELGIKFLKINMADNSSENKIASIHSDENYVVNSYTKKRGGSILSTKSASKETQMDSAFTSDSKFKNLEAEDFVMSLESREEKLSQNEFKRFKDDVRRMLPPDISSKVDYTQWIQGKEKRKNGYSRIQVALHPSAMQSLSYINVRNMTKLVSNHAAQMVNEGLAKKDDLIKLWGNDIEDMATQLSTMTDSTKSDKKRLGALMRLHNNSMFQQIGMRFVIDLIPANKREDVIKVQVKMDTTDGDKAFLNYGKVNPAFIYSWNRSAMALMGDEGIDLRLEAETIRLQKQ